MLIWIGGGARPGLKRVIQDSKFKPRNDQYLLSVTNGILLLPQFETEENFLIVNGEGEWDRLKGQGCFLADFFTFENSQCSIKTMKTP